jgi:hypothetical protein
MRGIFRGAAPEGLPAAVLAAALTALLAAGCSAGAGAQYRATADTCYAFGVRALQRKITVTAVPRACAGLSHAQVNLAVARAIRDVAGSRHRAVARRLAYQEGEYLAQLIGTVPPPGPAPSAAAPARKPAGLPLGLAALAAWIVTAAAGSYLAAGWLAHGGLRRRRTQAAGPPAVIIVSHFALAAAGLGAWIAFVAADVSVLAWIAVGLLVPVAGLGMAALVAALPEPAASGGATRPGPQLAARLAETSAPARARMPVTVIAAHGVLAMATILLVLLAAVGAA